MYRSPIYLAGLKDAGQAADKKALQLARKKMLAELELSGQESIIIDGTELSRQDIVRLFDDLNDEKLLAWHTAIWQDTGLRHFLETATLADALWLPNPLYHTPDFLQFVSPFYAAAMRKLLQQLLKGNGAPYLYRQLQQWPVLLVAKDVPACYDAITRFYLEKRSQLLAFIHRLETPQKAGVTVSAADIRAWCSINEIALLNMLPDELFAELRYSLAHMLNHICVVCDSRKRAYRTAYEALLLAAHIRSDDDLQRIITKNTTIIKNKQPLLEVGPDRKPVGKRKINSRSLGVLIGIIFIIIRLFSNVDEDNNSGTSPGYHYDASQAGQPATVSTSVDESPQLTDNYKALFNALSQEGSRVVFTDTTDTIQLSPATTVGADPLVSVWHFIYSSYTPAYSTNDIINKLPVKNKSSQALLALYITNNEDLHASFIPAHSTDTLRYSSLYLQLNLIPGAGWKTNVAHRVMLYQKGSPIKISVQMNGGFQHIPYNSQRTDDAPLTWLYQIGNSQKDDYGAYIVAADSSAGVSFKITASQQPAN